MRKSTLAPKQQQKNFYKNKRTRSNKAKHESCPLYRTQIISFQPQPLFGCFLPQGCPQQRGAQIFPNTPCAGLLVCSWQCLGTHLVSTQAVGAWTSPHSCTGHTRNWNYWVNVWLESHLTWVMRTSSFFIIFHHPSSTLQQCMEGTRWWMGGHTRRCLLVPKISIFPRSGERPPRAGCLLVPRSGNCWEARNHQGQGRCLNNRGFLTSVAFNSCLCERVVIFKQRVKLSEVCFIK